MDRISISPRTNWRKKVEQVGFVYHTPADVPYWNEEAFYSFSLTEILRIEEATKELHDMCLKAVEHVISGNRFKEMGLSDWQAALATASWKRGDKSLYGRMDLGYNGKDIKFLEYNADTPTSLLEAAVVQWFWKEDLFPDKDQFNSLHEALIARWKELPLIPTTFAAVKESDEDVSTVRYLGDTALQAGNSVSFISMEQIGWNGVEFTTLEEKRIQRLFKLYPLEYLTEEEFGKHLESVDLIEPAWKLILSNKAILPILWELFPNHPLLLKSSFTPFAGNVVTKPFRSREGANITISIDGKNTRTSGDYGSDNAIYQEYFPVPVFDGKTPVLGSWIVGDEPAGLGIREDDGIITGNLSRFVPHVIL